MLAWKASLSFRGRILISVSKYQCGLEFRATDCRGMAPLATGILRALANLPAVANSGKAGTSLNWLVVLVHCSASY